MRIGRAIRLEIRNDVDEMVHGQLWDQILPDVGLQARLQIYIPVRGLVDWRVSGVVGLRVWGAVKNQLALNAHARAAAPREPGGR